MPAGASATNTITGDTIALVDTLILSTSGTLLVTSTSNASATTTGGGGAVAIGFGAAVGVVKTTTTITRTTESDLGGNLQVGGLTVTATGNDEASTSTTALGGGLVGAGINLGTVTITPTVTASIDSGAVINDTGAADIEAVGSLVGNAKSVGVSVGALAVGLSQAELTLTPTIHTMIGQNASLIAGGSVTVNSQLLATQGGAVQGTVTTTASGGSFLGISGAESTQTVTDDVATMVGNNATISGATGLNVMSQGATTMSTTDTVATGGGLGLQKATGLDTVNTSAQTILGNNVTLAADRGILNLESENDVNLGSKVLSGFFGIGAGALADAEVTVNPLANANLAQTTIGAGSSIHGYQVNILAKVDPLSIHYDADGSQIDLGGYVNTTSIVTVNSTAEVDQQTGSNVTAQNLTVQATHAGVDIESTGAQTFALGLAPVHGGQITDNVTLNTAVNIAADAVLAANTILIQSNGGTGDVDQNESNFAIGIPIDTVTQSQSLNAAATIDIAGMLEPGTNSAYLFIDPTGTVDFNQSFAGAGLAVGTSISGANATIDGLQASAAPSLTVSAVTPTISVTGGTNNQSSKVTFESTASEVVPNRYSSVTILNQSTKNLLIDALDATLPGTFVTPSITAGKTVGTLTNGGALNLSGDIVDIGNTAAANVLLGGPINNPGGQTKIHTAGGSITVTGTGATTITTAFLNLEAPAGQIATSVNPIQASLVQDPGVTATPSLEAGASTGIAIALAAAAPAIAIVLAGIVTQTGNITLGLGGDNATIVQEMSAAGSVQITSAGSISDQVSTGPDIAGASLQVTGTGSFGTATDPIRTSVPNVAIDTSAGTAANIFFDSSQALDHRRRGRHFSRTECQWPDQRGFHPFACGLWKHRRHRQRSVDRTQCAQSCGQLPDSDQSQRRFDQEHRR